MERGLSIRTLDYFIKNVRRLSFEQQFKSRMLVSICLTAFIVSIFVSVAGRLGYHDEIINLELAVFFGICLLSMDKRLERYP